MTWGLGRSLRPAACDVHLIQLTADKELLITSVPLAVAFTKHLGTAFLPTAGTSAVPDDSHAPAGPTPAEAEAPKPREDDDDLVPAATKDKVRKLLVAYYDALSRRAIKDHTVSDLMSLTYVLHANLCAPRPP